MSSNGKWEKYKKLAGLYLSLVILILVSVAIYVYRNSIAEILSGTLGMLGFFVLSYVSCLSVIPLPYVLIIFRVAKYVNPLLTAIVVGLGSALGEATAWLVGRAASRALENSVYAKRINALLRFAEKKGSFAIPILAFLFSLTFLPDKVLYLPLGIMKYGILKLLPFTILGKALMTYLVLVFGKLWATYVEGYEEDIDMLSFFITTAILAVIMVVMVYIDWDKLLLKNEKS